MASSRFTVQDGEIVDLQSRQIISPDQFNSLATPEDRDSIEEQLGGLGMLESDSPALPGESDNTDPSAIGKPSSTAPSSGKPTLDEFMAAAREDNPGVPDRKLRQHWAKNYSDIEPKTLPALDAFLQAAKEDNPGVSTGKLRKHWEEHYGDFGALRETPPASSVLRRAADVPVGLAKGVVDLPKAALGLADIATGGYAGEGATAILDAMGSASDAVGLPAWARPSQWSDQLRNLYSKETKENLAAVSEKSKAAEAEAKESGSGALGQIAASAGGAIKGLASNPGALIPLAAENYGGMKAIAMGTAKLLAPLSKSLDASVRAGTMTAEEANAALGQAAIKYAAAGEGVLTSGQVSSGISAEDPSADFTHRLTAVLAGATTAGITRGAAKIPGHGDVEATMATSSLGKKTGFQGSLPARVGKGALSEGVIQELPQSAQESALQNIGASKPWQEGVGEQAIEAMAAGGALGGSMAGLSGERKGIISQAPAPTVDDIMAAPDVDTAIQQAQAMVSTAAKLETDEAALLEGRTPLDPLPDLKAPERTRQPFNVPILSTQAPQAAPTIEPGQAFNPRQEPEADPRVALQAERNRLIARREQASQESGTAQVSPEVQPSQQLPPELLGLDKQAEAPSKPLQTAIEKTMPTVQDIHVLGASKGFDVDGPTFHEYSKMVTGKSKLDDMSPYDLQRLADKLSTVAAKQTEQPATKPKEKKPPVDLPTGQTATETNSVPSMPSQPDPSELKAEPAELPSPAIQDEQPRPETAPTPKPTPLQAEKAKPQKPRAEKPSEGYRLLPQKTRTSFEAAWTGAETADRPSMRTLKEWVDPGNKTLRAEFERRSGVKLPKGLAATNAAVEEHFKPKTETNPLRETVDVSNDTPRGGNAAGEKLYERADGTRYRMRTDRKDRPYGYPDFGGDLSPVEKTQQQDGAEPFALTNQVESKPKAKGPEQLSIDVPPTQVAGQPIIGREAQPGEAPLFSEAAKQPDDVQTSLADQVPESPTQILADALRTAADKIDGKKKSKRDLVAGSLGDTGQKIGGARKDKWADRGLTLADLEGMTGGEEAKFIVKANIWKPDYAEMVKAGTEPKAAALVKIVHDRLAAKPSKDTPDGRRDYLAMMGHVKDAYAPVKTLDDVKRARQALLKHATAPGESGTSRLFTSVFRDRFEPFYLDSTAQRRAVKLVDEGFPNQEPWTRRYDITAIQARGLTDEGAKFYAARMVELDKSGNVAELAAAIKQAGAYEIREKNGRIVSYRLDRQGAEEQARSLYENKSETKDGGKEPARPHLDELVREGTDYRNGKDVTAVDFRKAFGFRGIEFGNYAASDERQKHVNQAYDALRDLADLLGIPQNAISLNGTLGLAFGSRGGGKAMAHYEPSKLVINITKINGPGALAHEWGHALDHYFGELDRPDAYKGKAKGASGWDTMGRYTGPSTRLGNLRPEMAQAFDKVMSALFQRNVTKAEAVRAAELKLEKLKKAVADHVNSNLKDLRESLKMQEEAAGRHLAKLTEEDRPEGGYGKVDTSFYKAAETLSGPTGKYWTRPTEMFARSFESYVFDRLEGKSDYLVHGVEEDKFTKEKGYKANPYPAGVDRPSINTAFNHLFDTMQSKQTDQGTALFDRRTSDQTETKAFANWFGESKVVDDNGKPLVVYHGTESSFDIFDKDRIEDTEREGGFFFSTKRRDANLYGKTVLPVYLSIQNPYTVTPSEWLDRSDPTPGQLKAQGYDGIKILGDPREQGHFKQDIYVAFEPTQIKSATGNAGTFDPKNPSILFNEREEPAPGAPTMQQFKRAWTAGASLGPGKKVIDSSEQYPAGMMEDLATRPYVKTLTPAMDSVMRGMTARLKATDANFGTPSFVGLSPDDYYVGVNLRGPDGIILNPWGALWRTQQDIREEGLDASRTPEYMAARLLKTMVHELTHQQVEGHDEQFDQQLEANYNALGRDRLEMWQRSLIHALEGSTDAIARDLEQQLPHWKDRAGLSDESRSRDAEPRPIFDRQNVADQGPSARGRPGEIVRESREDETASVDGSPSLQRRGSHSFLDPQDARDKLSAAKTSVRPYLLGALGLQQISDVYGKDHREVADYNSALQTMQADFVQTTQTSDKILKDWDKLKVPVADQMAKVMEDARFANFDPDPVKQQAAMTPAQVELKKRFKDMPEEAKAVYRAARDYYTELAESRFRAIKDRINRAGGSPDNRRALIDRLQVAYEKTKAKVYFPFTRFGDHIVVAKKMEADRLSGKMKESDREVQAFNSPADANKFAMQMKARGWTVKQTTSKQYSLDRDGGASKAVREILDVVDNLGTQDSLPGIMSSRAQLKDAINQSFLNSLPDMSYAKHFIHAKEVKGASRDALRSFAHSALHGAHHISRIRYADRLSDAVMALDERVNETEEGDVTEARQVYNELVQRHNAILNPNTHPFSAWLGQMGFTMSLGGVVATGVTNMTQVPLITLPWLGSRYGFGKSTAALAAAYKDFLDPATLNKDSLFDASKSARISAQDRAILEALQKRGRIDLTQTMDLSGRASQDNLSRVAKQTGSIQSKITQMLGFTFHAPEVANRQVTALATARLAREGGATEAEVLAKAEQAIVDTHFIYDSSNRARYMSGNVLRVLFMFKQYSANIAYLYGRSAQVWLDKNNATPEERSIAKKQLLSMAALQFAAAGALGMPFVGTVASLFTAVLNGFGDDDDKWDWEVELRKFLADQFGKEAGEVLSHGVSRLTPWDMAGRLGQADLFFREPSREREGRAAAMDWLTSFAGPVLGYAVNSYLGAGDVAKGIKNADAGSFIRGAEELSPAVIRHQLRALRYEIEGGMRTRDKIKQLDLSYAEKLGQYFGFSPSRVAESYSAITAVKNKEHQITERRKELLDGYAAAIRNHDRDARHEVMAEIREFNKRNTALRISGDTLLRSIKAREQRQHQTKGGLYLPRKRESLRQEGSFANY